MTRRRADEGYTLIELLVSITILGIIIGPLSAALISGLLTTSIASQRTTSSNDAQVTADYLITDVQSAATVGNTSSTCTSSGVTPLLALTWTEQTSTTSTAARAVTYGTATDSDGNLQLRRVNCTNGSVLSTNVVGRTLASTPTVTCDGAACPSTPGTARVVQVTYTDSGNGRGTDPYPVTLTANRRSS